MRLIRSSYTLGWISAAAPLSAAIPLSSLDLPELLSPGLSLKLPGGGSLELPRGERLRLEEGGQILVTSPGGLHHLSRPPELRALPRPLSRRAFLEEAFYRLGRSYGWGGQGGGLDCSRLVMDIFSSFGLHLPRFSGNQARAGSFSIDLKEIKSEKERLLLIDAAAERGIVLLQFPGHIMIYLGHAQDGRPMALHSFAEYLAPCPEGVKTQNKAHETLFKVGSVSLSDLELGRGSSRSAFIERVERVVVFGHPPGIALQGAAEQRPAAATARPTRCQRSRDYPLFLSPKQPNSRQALRVLAPHFKDPGAARLQLFGPDGRPREGQLKRLGGPPYTQVLSIKAPEPGRWRVLLGDGPQLLSCRSFQVKARVRPQAQGGSGPVWKIEEGWGPQMENLYSGFIESLFDYPEDGRTWSNLNSLLSNPERNLLFNHLSREEERQLRLTPDCADLPYFLRAYFAWKMALPFGYRTCSRSRKGRPTRCQEVEGNLIERSNKDPVKAFARFMRKLKSAVHSSSARTRPEDEESDLYPVPMNRMGLRPGATYADPYGHTLILVKWSPQSRAGYGRLIAADAQPDSTIGRRRFWRGSFLFTAETDNVGAGFKAFRPLIVEGGVLQARENSYLSKSKRLIPFSQEQYATGDDGFYEKMAALINPRPLDPEVRMIALVEALHEVLTRRVQAIETGEKFMASRSFRPIKMPKGASIFLTSGPWEDFSTPSRDMRMLISIDTVLRFPDRVARAPQRFGLEAGQVQATVRALREKLKAALEARGVRYQRSDGSEQRLSLKQIVDRQEQLELAYNPNDCIELRWGAAEGSPERASCRRHAPADQSRKMKRYRPWFKARKRPGS